MRPTSSIMLCGAALSVASRRVGAFVTSSTGRNVIRSGAAFQAQAHRTLKLHALSQPPPDFTVVDDDDNNHDYEYDYHPAAHITSDIH